MKVTEQNRKEAVNALITIAVVEGVVLMAVVGVYLWSGNLVYLIGGIIGSTLIFAPMFLRWFKEHGRAMNPKDEEGAGG